MPSARTIFVALSICLLAGLAVAENSAIQPRALPTKDMNANVAIAELPIEATIEVSPRYECSRAGKPIAIDGNLSDWADIPGVMLNTRAQARDVSGEWDGTQDASGTMQMAWDSDYLYLAFDVTDDVFSQPFTDEGIWAGDCVQFAFDALEDRKKDSYAPDDSEFSLALTEDGPVLWKSGGEDRIESARIACVRKPGGVVYELAIGWSAVQPLAPIRRESFGFTFTINDNDGGSIKSFLQWTDGIYHSKDPSSFGQVIMKHSPRADGRTELYISANVPLVIDVEKLDFQVSSFSAKPAKLTASMQVTDGNNFASEVFTTELNAGVNRRQITWKVPTLPDGMYDGKLSVLFGDRKAETEFKYLRIGSAPAEAKLKVITDQIARLARGNNPLYERYAASMEYRLQTARAWIEGARSYKRLLKLDELLNETESIATSLAAGSDWFANRRGEFCRAYRAPEDDSIQPYRLVVPRDYDANQTYPLIVLLHGFGGKSLTFDNWWAIAANKHLEPLAEECVIVIPYGRGNFGWTGIGAADAMHTMAAAMRDYNIDPDRLYVAGFSMGGAGTWYMATRYPDLWAACNPQAGRVGTSAWEKYRQTPPAAGDWKGRLYSSDSRIFVFENLLNVPAIIAHGVADSAVGYSNARAAFKRLGELSYQAVLIGDVRLGHETPTLFRKLAIDWMLQHKRDPAPKRAVYRTFDLRFNKAYWVEIDDLVEHYRLSELDARISGQGTLDIRTTNISRLTLDVSEKMLAEGKPLAIEIDGGSLSVEAKAGDKLHLARHGGKWAIAESRYRGGVVKKHGLSGPMSEIFSGPFIIVYGTAGSKESAAINAEAAEKYAREMNGAARGRLYGNFRVIKDVELKDTDVKQPNLILFGGPATNAVTARISDKLPMASIDGKLMFRGRVLDSPGTALKFIYPNPLEPGRYVLVHCGATSNALANIKTLARPMPDWQIFTDASTQASKRFAEAGFFDRDWK